MNSTVLNVKIDKNLKEETQRLAAEMGLPVSTVVAAGLREFVRTRMITFSQTPQLKPEIETELLRLSKAAKEGKGLSPAFTAVDEALIWLNQ